MVLSGRVWLHLLWSGSVVTWFVTGNRPPSRSAGALGIVDMAREVVPLQAYLPAFDEPEYGDAPGVNVRDHGPGRLASYARTKDWHAREEPGDRLPPYDPDRSGQPPGTDGREQDAMETCVGVPRGVPVGTRRRPVVLAAG